MPYQTNGKRICLMEELYYNDFSDKQIKFIVNYRMTSIIPDKLYLGSYADAMDLDSIRSKGITHIIQLVRDVSHIDTYERIVYYHIPISDNNLVDILPIFKEYVPIIDNIILNGGRILIHCAMGISRSASLCIAYMAHRTRKPIDEIIKSINRPINPNEGFRKALEIYVNEL